MEILQNEEKSEQMPSTLRPWSTIKTCQRRKIAAPTDQTSSATSDAAPAASEKETAPEASQTDGGRAESTLRNRIACAIVGACLGMAVVTLLRSVTEQVGKRERAFRAAESTPLPANAEERGKNTESWIGVAPALDESLREKRLRELPRSRSYLGPE